MWRSSTDRPEAASTGAGALPWLCVAALVGLCVSVPAGAAAPVTEPGKPDVAQRLARIEQLLDSRGLLDLLTQIENLEQEIRRLRGDMEVQAHALEELRGRQRDLYTDLDRRMQQLEGGGVARLPAPAGPGPLGQESPPLETLPAAPPVDELGPAGESGSALTLEMLETPRVATAPAPAARTPAPAGEPGGEAPGSDPVQAQAAYQNAFRLLKQSLYQQAIKSFREFLAAYPDSEFSDNAQYWLGEAHFVTGDFPQAITEYNQVVTRYPQSQKLTDAQLKIGYSHLELGRLAEARRQLEELIRNHPGTTAARLAEERLRQIRSSPQAEAPAQ